MKRYILYTVFFLLATISCSNDDNGFDIIPSIGFASVGGTLLENNNAGIQVGVYTNVTLTETVTAEITFNNFQNLDYGVDFTTEPALQNNKLYLTLTPESNTVSFFVYPTFTSEDRLLNFSLTGVEGGSIQLGQPASLTYNLTIKSLGCPQGVQPVTVSHNFDGCIDFATPSGFIEAFEPGSKEDRGWGCRNFGRNSTRAVRASAFGGTTGDDKAWLIMNPVRVANGSTVKIHFWAFSNFTGPGSVKVKWSSDYSGSGNPLVATWTDLTVINNQIPAAGSATWKEINETFTNICGAKVYLAFQFTGATNAASASWDIEDLTFTVE